MSDKTFYLIVGMLIAVVFTFSPNAYHQLAAAILVVVLLIIFLRGAK